MIESDHWYTPPTFIESIIDLNPGHWLDVMTSANTPKVKGLEKYYGDIYSPDFKAEVRKLTAATYLWCNPPYSRESGGAQKHIRRLDEVFDRRIYGAVYLVNYDAWVPRLAAELNMSVALVYPRIRFLRPDGLPGPSPRHANVLLYWGVDLPYKLGGDYEILEAG